MRPAPAARLAMFVVLVTLFGRARQGASPVSASAAAAPPPPFLAGEVVDGEGRPISAAEVHIYTGLADWYPLSACHTDSRGQFESPITSGVIFWNSDPYGASFSVGIRIECAGASNPDGGLNWIGTLPMRPPGNLRIIRFQIKRGIVAASEIKPPAAWEPSDFALVL